MMIGRSSVHRTHTASIRSTAARAAGGDAPGSIVTSWRIVSSAGRMLRQRDALHVRAQVARAHELDLRVLHGDVVAHRAFGDQHHARRLLRRRHSRSSPRWSRRNPPRPPHPAGIPDAPARPRPGCSARSGRISAAVKRSCTSQCAGPGDDFDAGLARRRSAPGIRPGSMITSGTPSDSTTSSRVAGGAADIGLRLHRGRGVDVGDHRDAGIALAQQPDIGRRDRARQRAAGRADPGSARSWPGSASSPSRP